VHDVVRDVIALVRPQRAFKSVTIETELEDRQLRVALSAPRLTQVLLNLLLNAGDAASGRDASAKRGVTVRAASAGDRVLIEVDDTGPGIAPEIRGKLFEPFVTTKEVGTGTGLGLAVCRGIVESAGGEINLDDSFTGGARFVVSLPVAR
jgi:two-component system, NtrC family, sensor kinase